MKSGGGNPPEADKFLDFGIQAGRSCPPTGRPANSFIQNPDFPEKKFGFRPLKPVLKRIRDFWEFFGRISEIPN
uniref:Uncharacterized protein n=1 Tax=candidate division CPR3 bacterium TaxID=2268181 RepID=A0A7C4R8M4_UNCC3